MKTTLTSYYFDTRNPEERAAYAELKKQLSATNGECFCTWGGKGSHYNAAWKHGIEVELEAKYLFANQWNTASLRVFDWAEDYPINFDKHIKRGHYLTITDEMRAIRHNTLKCGYCGHMEPAAAGLAFCPKCTGSEYLKEDELHLTRLLPIDSTESPAPLTDLERAERVPIYHEAQGLGMVSRETAARAGKRQRIAALIPEAKEKAAKLIKEAEIKTAAYTWLMNHGWADLDNMIYYTHTGRFCFGWSKSLSHEQESALQDLLCDFPYDYDLK